MYAWYNDSSPPHVPMTTKQNDPCPGLFIDPPPPDGERRKRKKKTKKKSNNFHSSLHSSVICTPLSWGITLALPVLAVGVGMKDEGKHVLPSSEKISYTTFHPHDRRPARLPFRKPDKTEMTETETDIVL
ncbi:hypothetical protein L249_2935 [Ophiocordyceps polyrhachis-furcata BCC 54312]|uniref:Uncharacterized protein n=1 Tax=Ophiocordyceps polyrhachis-furcata BCC 54312 TaxID=1330021 RepID=A0A367LSS3_9HYPO|nr:hypothetical protein L249_2935 [Ophiocordyceps polyrhachis-furcata BCC 54312]